MAWVLCCIIIIITDCDDNQFWFFFITYFHFVRVWFYKSNSIECFGDNNLLFCTFLSFYAELSISMDDMVFVVFNTTIFNISNLDTSVFLFPINKKLFSKRKKCSTTTAIEYNYHKFNEVIIFSIAVAVTKQTLLVANITTIDRHAKRW